MTDQLNNQLQERFLKLPKVVQDAITSADIEAHLRSLADTHRLHLDQWELLENEVMLALLGFQPTADLAENIQKQVHVDTATAESLAADISSVVFEPIRKELERELDHPAATAVEKTGVETMRDEVLAGSARTDGAATAPTSTPIPPAAESAPAAPTASEVTPLTASTPIAPATPPNPVPEVTVERTSATPGYVPSVASHERKTIDGDPYREPIR